MNGWPSVEWAETLMQVIGPEQDGHLGGGLVGPRPNVHWTKKMNT